MMRFLFKVGSYALLAMMLFGCASKVEYGDAQAVETVNAHFGSTDLQQIAAKMVDSMLTTPSIIVMTAHKKPVLVVDVVRNKTLEHIDTESVTDTIVNKLLRSGKFNFGQKAGAEHLIYGNLSSITKSNNKTEDVYYKFTLKMQNISTGLLEWQEEKEIRKQVNRTFFGL